MATITKETLVTRAGTAEIRGTVEDRGLQYVLLGAQLVDMIHPEAVEGGPYRLYTLKSRLLIECVPTGRVFATSISELVAFAVRAGLCRQCDKPTGGRARCAVHAAEDAARHRLARARKRGSP